MKNTLIKGTFILTVTGLFTRILGFFYRIYLADAIGAEMLGIYQLIFPVYGICYTLYASGIQTAVSKLTAEASAQNNPRRALHILKTASLVSFCLATGLTFLVFQNGSFIASSLLMEPRAAKSLKLLSFSFPFCSLTACINGYYYGLKKTAVPAVTQLLEQIIRIVSVFLFATILTKDISLTCELAVIGLVLGEAASCFYNLFSLPFSLKNEQSIHRTTQKPSSTSVSAFDSSIRSVSRDFATSPSLLRQLTKLALPLSSNRLIINLLHSLEAVLVPYLLKQSGLSDPEALRLFGILNGMVLPFILFPSTITNALSVVLLPAVSEANAAGKTASLQKTSSLSIQYSLLIGIFSSSFFLYFGMPLGTLFFHETLAGTYLRILSFLCPFLYVATTLNSILNGLGKAHLTFYTSVGSMVIRILLLLLLTPKTGLYGYLIAILISQLFLTLCDSGIVWYLTKAFPSAVRSILLPAFFSFAPGMLFLNLYYRLQQTQLSPLLLLTLISLLFCFCYFALLLAGKIIQKKDLL